MSQSAYNSNIPPAFAGMKADIQNDRVESHVAKDEIALGAALAAEAGDPNFVRMPVVNVNTIDFSADLITANVFDATGIDSVDLTPVTFTVDHNSTMAAIVAAIEAQVTTVTATKTGPREITVSKDSGAAIVIAGAAVTGGTTQPTTAVTASTNDVFRGVALHKHIPATDAGVAQYVENDSVDTLKQGQVWVNTSVAVAVDDTAYALKDGTGRFTNVAGSNLVTGGVFKSATTGAGLAKLQIAVL